MTDRRLTAEECFRHGFANKVVKRDDVLQTAVELAKATTLMGPDSIRTLREGSIRLQKECGLVFEDSVIEERRKSAREHIAQQRSDTDLMEGMQAFAEKRTAEYAKPS